MSPIDSGKNMQREPASPLRKASRANKNMASVGRSPSSSFTHNGLYFALLSVDGRLRIWDTVSGKLLQEYTPAAHLETTFTCLGWVRKSTEKRSIPERKGVKRKKRGNEDDSDRFEDDAVYPDLVLGSSNGKILLYNPIAGDVHSPFADNHLQRVNDISYCTSRDAVYSCSSDRNIMEWQLSSKERQSTWKGDSISVEKLVLTPCENALLSAGKTIKLWNLDTKDLLMTFNGHTSTVSLLDFTYYKSPSVHSNFDWDGRYFLSGSVDDRVISVWHINRDAQEKASMATCMLSDVPLSMDSVFEENSDKPLKLCVACKDGKIQFFANSLNGRAKRPLVASKVLLCLQKEGKKSKPTPIPVLKTCLKKIDGDVECLLVAGAAMKPRFEKHLYSKLDEFSTVVYEGVKNLLLTDAKQDTLTTVNYAKQDTSAVAVDAATPMLAVKTLAGVPDEDNMIEVSLEERLKGKKAAVAPLVAKPRKESNSNELSHANMLIQGLHSGDEKMLQSVLLKRVDDLEMQSTVRRVPHQLIARLLNELLERLQESPWRMGILLKWFRAVITTHLTSLISDRAQLEAVGKLYRVFQNQADLYPKLVRLEGKLELLLTQVHDKPSPVPMEAVSVPAVVYNEDSDSDEAEFGIGKSGTSDDEGWNPAEEEEDLETGDEVSADDTNPDGEHDTMDDGDDQDDDDDDTDDLKSDDEA